MALSRIRSNGIRKSVIALKNKTKPTLRVLWQQLAQRTLAEDRGAGARGTRVRSPSFLPHTSFPARSCHLDRSLKI